MKKFTLALAAVLGFVVLTPSTAEAGGCRTRVNVDHYGYTVHSEYRRVGVDCHGCPIFRWVIVRRERPCDRGYAGHGHDYGHDREYGHGRGRGDRHSGGHRGHGHGHDAGYSGRWSR